MNISFTNKRLKKTCLSDKERRSEYGQLGARILERRLTQMEDAMNLEQLRNQPGHWHELTGDCWGQLAANLDGGNRLVFEPDHDPLPTKPDGGLDWNQVSAVVVIEIINYH